MPPCRRKLSMPARSVSTWKLIARRPFTTANVTILATSQPAISTSIASASLGRNTPICVRTTRTGSNSISTFSMTASLTWVPHGPARHRQQPLQRHVDPTRPVVDLVAQFVASLLDLEQLQQCARVVERRVQAAFPRRLVIGGQKRLPRQTMPGRGKVAKARALLGRLGGAPQLCPARIVERAQHAGHVP